MEHAQSEVTTLINTLEVAKVSKVKTRTILKLFSYGITTVEQLRKLSNDDFRRIKGIGPRSVALIRHAIRHHDKVEKHYEPERQRVRMADQRGTTQ